MNHNRPSWAVRGVPVGAALGLLAWAVFTSAAAGRTAPQLWFYYSTNLLVNANVRTLDRIWHDAAADGYSHVLLCDSKFARLGALGSIRRRYLAHLAHVMALAKQLHLTVVPDVFQVGYSNDLLANDPALAAGLPVRDVKFIVRSGVGRVWQKPKFGFSARPAWQDSSVRRRGQVATITNNSGNSRMVFALAVQPFHAYHIRVDIRTRRYTGRPRIAVLARGNASLQYQRINVRPSQPWRRYDVVFDSLAHHHVNVYFGVWGAAKGVLGWRNWHVAVAGLVNVLSRPGAPTVVQGYQAGRDYVPIHDPLLGTTARGPGKNNFTLSGWFFWPPASLFAPYRPTSGVCLSLTPRQRPKLLRRKMRIYFRAVPYSGEYTAWHKCPSIHFLKAVPNGSVVRVSWFYPPIFYDGQVSIALGCPRTKALLRQEMRQVKAVLHPQGYMMSFDEIRIMGWGLRGTRPHELPGRLLAGSVRYCTHLLGTSQGYIWSDMFDPYHNAHAHYYLVHGSLAGSWRGLSPKVVVMNWNFGRRDASLKFFATRGYRQIIAGYYDSPLANLRLWMASAAGVHGVIGYMYTTWRGDYQQLGAFAQMVRHEGTEK